MSRYRDVELSSFGNVQLMSKCRDVRRDVEMSRCRDVEMLRGRDFGPGRGQDLLQGHENPGISKRVKMAAKVFTVFLLSSTLFFRSQAALGKYLPVLDVPTLPVVGNITMHA